MTATKSANPAVHGGVAEGAQEGGQRLAPRFTAGTRVAAGDEDRQDYREPPRQQGERRRERCGGAGRRLAPGCRSRPGADPPAEICQVQEAAERASPPPSSDLASPPRPAAAVGGLSKGAVATRRCAPWLRCPRTQSARNWGGKVGSGSKLSLGSPGPVR